MLLLVSTPHPHLYQHGLEPETVHPNLGRLFTPRHTSRMADTAEAGIPWAADNDCFQGLDEVAYRKMLDKVEGLPGCEFVTVPDVVGDAATTLELFETWAPELQARGFPLALVGQDGLEARREQIAWDAIAALFMGGSTEWKEGPDAAELALEAKERGKWVHWGRVNTKRRLDLIVENSAGDSFDGSKWCRWRKAYLDTGLSWAQAITAVREGVEEATRAPAGSANRS